MSLFEKNLDKLSLHDPALADRLRDMSVPQDLVVLPARSGEAVVQWNDVLLHSRYQPSTEAARLIDHYDLAQAEAVILVGFGFGYHVRELVRRVTVPVVVIEAFPEILRAAMEHVDLRELWGRVRFLIGNPASSLSQCAELQTILSRPHTIIPHPPSLQCASEYYAALARELERRQPLRVPGQLRVLVVSPLYGGSLPTARYAAQALRRLGCTVELLDYSPFNPALRAMQNLLREPAHKDAVIAQFSQSLSLMACARAREFNADLVFALAQAPLTRDALRMLRANRIRTAFWFVENYKCFPYWREVASEYDYFFTIQSGAFIDELRKLGVFQAYYLPTACDPEIHRAPVLSPEDSRRYGADVSFAGFGYYNRKILFEGLLDFDLKIWGPGWNDARGLHPCLQDGGQTFAEAEMLKIFAGAKINLNLHSSTYYAGVEPGGDFVNPRLFELASCGAFQLVDDRPPVREFFIPDEEVACFSDLPTLRRQIRYYLDHPEERRRMAHNAQRRAQREHTYTARMRSMLSWIFSESLIDDLGRQRALDTAEHWRRQLPADHDLQPVLAGYDPAAPVTLDGLLAHLCRADRYQSEPELLLRLMKNLVTEGRKR